MRPFVGSKIRMRRGASRRRAKGQPARTTASQTESFWRDIVQSGGVPRPAECQVFQAKPDPAPPDKFRVLPEGRNGAARAVVAPPVGAQADLAGIGVAVHDHHVPPPLAVVLGDIRLVSSAVPGAPPLVVDGLDALGVEPGEHETLVRERLGAAHGGDVLTLPEGRQVGDDAPVHRGVVGSVAVQEPEAIHQLALVGHRLRVEQLPAPELRLPVNALDGGAVDLEGERHSLGPLAEAEGEGAVGVAPGGPGRGGHCETVEDLLGDAPVAGGVLLAQGRELLVHRLLEGVAVARPADEVLDDGRVVALANPGGILDGDPRVGEHAKGGIQFGLLDFDEAFHDGIALQRHE